MNIEKAYKRIFRPVMSYPDNGNYVLDSRYSNDRGVLCRSYKIIETDLKKIFEYVEPCDDNTNVYSHRIYELFFRASTEFETNCKRILEANGYNVTGNLNITDYYKIERATKLSEYRVFINTWYPQEKLITPFIQWEIGHTLSWYQAYNNVKHDRISNFRLANIDNLVFAVSGLFSILFAQFGYNSLNPYQQTNIIDSNDNGSVFHGDSFLSIIPPNWSSEDMYYFNWETIKESDMPFADFPF